MSLFFRKTAAAAVVIAAAATFPLVASSAEAAPLQTRPAHSHTKPVKKFQARYVLTGRVTAVAEDGVTVKVKGGNLKKSVRGKEVAVTFDAATKITVEGVTKTLADIVVGDRVTIKGVRARTGDVTTYTAKRVHVKHVVVKTEEPAPATETVAS